MNIKEQDAELKRKRLENPNRDYLSMLEEHDKLKQRVQMLESLLSSIQFDLKEIKEAIADVKQT
jgi:chromosome segregation ATPase